MTRRAYDMTDPLLDEASWLDAIDVGRIRDDRAVYAVVDWTRTVGDLRRLLARARDAERLRTLAWDLRGAVSNLPERYSGFGLVRRHEVDDAIVLVLQRYAALGGTDR